MKARDLINEMTAHDCSMEIYARVKIINPNGGDDGYIDVPLGKVERKNEGPIGPRLVIEAPAEITANVEFSFSINQT